MPNVSSIQTPVMDMYQHLDKMQDLLKIVAADYKVRAKELDFSIALPEGKIEEIKAQYVNIVQAIRSCVGRLPASL